MAGKKRGASSAAQSHKTANAARRAKGRTTHENPLLPHKTLKQMHAALLAARKLERSAATLLRKRNAAGITGREAALLGIAIHLQPQDKVSAASSDVMLRLLRGAQPAAIARELRAKSPRTAEANGNLPPIANPSDRLAIATGVALAAKSSQTDNSAKNTIVVAYLEAADLEDNSHIAIIQTAGRLELPIVFLCLDDPKVSQQARARQWTRLRSALLLKGGVELVPAIPVDGHDIVAMYRAAQESVLRARSGIGPTLLWCERWHLGPAHPDALANFERYLAAKGLLPGKHNVS